MASHSEFLGCDEDKSPVIRVALVHPAPEPPNPLCLGPHLVPGPDLQQGSNWEKKRKKLE